MNLISTLLAGLIAFVGPPELVPTPASPVQVAAQIGDERPVRSRVLPSGLRVIVAQDDTLPVAAVVLALDVGMLDDPEDKTGLVHTLAYHLQQGNRELSPGQAVGEAHDAGGLSEMSIGHASIRFSSIVPVAQLDRMLWVESHRLRLPTVNNTLWLKSISNARNDQRPRLLIEQAAVAAAWADPRLAENRRKAGKQLGDLEEQQLIAALDSLTIYPRATLAVVGPESPEKLLERVEKAFVDVPEAARQPETHPAAVPPAPAQGTPPRPVELKRSRGDTFVWPVEPTLRSRVVAQSLCGTLNRQRPSKGESRKTKLRCVFQDDTRFPTLSVRIAGTQDPAADAVAARIKRVADGSDDVELTKQVEKASDQVRADLRRPLELAKRLAVVPADSPANETLTAMLGAQGLTLQDVHEEIAAQFGLESAAALVPAPKKASKGDDGDEQDDASAKPSTRGSG